jgi:translation initiation factor 3 subunit D
MASFSLPSINDNPDGSWGPSSFNMPAEYKFREIPYAPYSKSDKLGRFADWYEGSGESRNVGTSISQGARPTQNRGKRDAAQAYGSGAASAFAYFHVEDESSFSLVDSKATTVRRGGPINRGRNSTRGMSNYNRGNPRGGRGGFTQRGGGSVQRGGIARRGWRDWDKVAQFFYSLSWTKFDKNSSRIIARANPLLL